VPAVETIRLLLVDDQPAIRRGLRMWLALEPDLVVVGEAEDGEQVCPLIGRLHPDVVLMDLAMPGLDGMGATALVHLLEPDLPVVMLSLHDDREVRARALTAGVAAFVSKHEMEPALVEAIRGAARRRRGCRRPAQH
jgi:HlyD family secretion protein